MFQLLLNYKCVYEYALFCETSYGGNIVQIHYIYSTNCEVKFVSYNLRKISHIAIYFEIKVEMILSR